jgi:hypothetical protein
MDDQANEEISKIRYFEEIKAFNNNPIPAYIYFSWLFEYVVYKNITV